MTVNVSYIITTRNRAKFLDRALHNAREYLTPEDELIVIDGGSSDETPAVIEKHRDIIAYTRSERDFGEADGFNRGLLVARGRFIKPITDDDYFYPEAMHRAIALLEEHPEIEAAICGGEAWEYDEATGREVPVCYQHLTREFHHGQWLCGIGLILTRPCLTRVGLFDPSYLAIDTEYESRLAACKVNFRYLNLKLYRHVEYPHSGQQQRHRCRTDQISILLRHGQWPEAADFRVEHLQDALGLASVPGGYALGVLICYAERLRRGWLRPLLYIWGFPFLAFQAALEAARYCNRFVQRQWHRRHPRRRPPPPPEPVWDGSIW